MFADIMIGFFFRHTNRAHLYELEYQHAAAFLGGPVTYRGRDLAVVHKPLRIMGGQFARRLRILEEVLQSHAVAQSIAQPWIEHQRQQLGLVVTGPAGTCQVAPAPTSRT